MDMRRIASKEDIDKKRKRNQIIVGVILIFVMLSSVIGFGFVNNASTGQGDIGAPAEIPREIITYNGFDFENVAGFWVLSNFPETFFQFNPTQTEELSVNDINGLENYRDKELYIYSDNLIAQQEVANNMNSQVLRMQRACLSNELIISKEVEMICEVDIPIKTCDDNFIIIKESEENSITQDNNCVFISAKPGEDVEIVDEFLFHVFGVK